MAHFDWPDRSGPDLIGFDGMQPLSGRKAGNPHGHATKLPEGKFRFIALDVETACRDAASICQIGLACVAADNSILTWSTLVDPRMPFDAFNTQLHGIGPETVADAPDFPQAYAMLLPLLRRHHLVQHSNFDRRAISAACETVGLAMPDMRWSDSVAIARQAWPELRGNGGHGLANLKRRLRLKFHHHDAGEDARAAAEVVLHAETVLGMTFDRLTLSSSTRKRTAATAHAPNPDGPLAGTVVVFTGKLGLSRDNAARRAAEAGMSVQSRVTHRTTHLVVGETVKSESGGPTKSRSLRQAEELRDTGCPIRILDETGFHALIRDTDP